MPLNLELLYFEILTSCRKVTNVRYKVPAVVGTMPRIETTPQNKFTLLFSFTSISINRMFITYFA